MNQCNFIGRIGQDPEIKYTASGDAVANISIATTKRYKDKQGVKQEKTTWVRCSAFGKTAELISQFVQKGSQLRVTTEYETREWQDQNGAKQYGHSFNIRDMEFLGGNQSSNGQANNQSQNKPPQQPQYTQPNGQPMNPQQVQQQQQNAPAYAPNDFDDDDVPFSMKATSPDLFLLV